MLAVIITDNTDNGNNLITIFFMTAINLGVRRMSNKVKIQKTTIIRHRNELSEHLQIFVNEYFARLFVRTYHFAAISDTLNGLFLGFVSC